MYIDALNLYTGWVGIFVGCVAGAVGGLFFHGEEWLGGYGSWRRRMVRLGHISFFGIGFINIAFGLTVGALGIEDGAEAGSYLLLIGAAGMPAVCYLSAYRKFFRHLFFIPALSVIAGVGLLIWRLFLK